MARRNSRNDGDQVYFDTRTNAVMARQTDGIKEKVKRVLEVVSGQTKDDIYVALEYYEQDVERTISAFLENGAKEALEQWTFTGTKPNTKKKKNKSKAQQATGPKDSTKPGSQEIINVQTNPSQEEAPLRENAAEPAETSVTRREEDQTTPVTSANTGLASPKTVRLRTDSNNSNKSAKGVKEKRPTLDISKDISKPLIIATASSNAPSTTLSTKAKDIQQQRPKTLEASKSRDRTISEASASSVSGRGKGPHAGLEKSLKDLNRQISSLTRLKSILKEKSDEGTKRLQQSFKSLQSLLSDREVTLMYELQKNHEEADKILAQRQKTAANLKLRVDRAPSMKEHDLAELRAEIKHFVSERKIDEDLGSTQRLVLKEVDAKDFIDNFGEVLPPKVGYSQRRLSVSSSVSSSAVSDMELLSPQTPITPSSASAVFSPPIPKQVMAPLSAPTQPQLGGAKVLSQSDSLTKYEIQNKDKLAEVKPKQNYSGPRPAGGNRTGPSNQVNRQQRGPARDGQPQNEQQTSSTSSPDGNDEEIRKSRNARRRMRQKEKQKEFRRTQQNSDGGKHEHDDDNQGHKQVDFQKKTYQQNSPTRRTPSGGYRNNPSNQRGQYRTPSPRKGQRYQQSMGQGDGSNQNNRPRSRSQEQRNKATEKRNASHPDSVGNATKLTSVGEKTENKAEVKTNALPSHDNNKDTKPKEPAPSNTNSAKVNGNVDLVNGDNGQVNGGGFENDGDALPQRKPRAGRADRGSSGAATAAASKSEPVLVNGSAQVLLNGGLNGHQEDE